MKKLFIFLVGLMPILAWGAFPTHSNISTVKVSQAVGNWDGFKWTWFGFNDQSCTLLLDTDMTGYIVCFKTMRTNLVFNLNTNCTVSTTNISWTIAHTNVPPNGSYKAEVWSYDNASTSLTRTLAQGTIIVQQSLYQDNAANFPYPTNAIDMTAYLLVSTAAKTYVATNDAVYLAAPTNFVAGANMTLGHTGRVWTIGGAAAETYTSNVVTELQTHTNDYQHMASVSSNFTSTTAGQTTNFISTQLGQTTNFVSARLGNTTNYITSVAGLSSNFVSVVAAQTTNYISSTASGLSNGIASAASASSNYAAAVAAVAATTASNFTSLTAANLTNLINSTASSLTALVSTAQSTADLALSQGGTNAAILTAMSATNAAQNSAIGTGITERAAFATTQALNVARFNTNATDHAAFSSGLGALTNRMTAQESDTTSNQTTFAALSGTQALTVARANTNDVNDAAYSAGLGALTNRVASQEADSGTNQTLFTAISTTNAAQNSAISTGITERASLQAQIGTNSAAILAGDAAGSNYAASVANTAAAAASNFTSATAANLTNYVNTATGACLQITGGNAMAGTLNMGNNAITNLNSISFLDNAAIGPEANTMNWELCGDRTLGYPFIQLCGLNAPGGVAGDIFMGPATNASISIYGPSMGGAGVFLAVGDVPSWNTHGIALGTNIAGRGFRIDAVVLDGSNVVANTITSNKIALLGIDKANIASGTLTSNEMALLGVDVANVAGLGTAARSNVTDFATAADGALAQSAVQPTDTDTMTWTNRIYRYYANSTNYIYDVYNASQRVIYCAVQGKVTTNWDSYIP